MTRYRTTTVPVRGGELTVGIWEPAEAGGGAVPTVLAIHGITASHLAWQWLAAELPEARIVAPDLRGRGASRSLPGPWGMRGHAADALTVIDEFELDSPTVVGHSMGAFVAAALAHDNPDRIDRVVLVDGGLPLPSREITDGEDAALALLGPAAERLRMRFADRESYRDFWRAHPAFSAAWTAGVEAYVDYDLVGTAPDLHSASVLEAVAADALELNDATTPDGTQAQLAALESLAAPIPFLRAPRDLLDRPGGLYPPQAVERWLKHLPAIDLHEVEDVNHYSIIMSENGVATLARVLRETLAAHSGQHNPPSPTTWQRSPA